ncbi:MAG: signal peptidase I [Verrucomicrobia bacterium]|nr:signal peptidase I [Verrucomicrobiota bacterium]
MSIAPVKQNDFPKKPARFWHEWAKPVITVLLLTSAFRSAIADWNDVPTGSMKPTILEGDRIFVNKLAYDLKVPFTTARLARWAEPERGEVVVCFSPADGVRLVKRVVGLPGDQIELRDERLLVNGTAVNYGALEERFRDQIEPTERPFYEFAREDLAAHPHLIMLTPQLAALRNFAPVAVPTGNYFVMGDNRDNSRDSRYFGCVSREKILGRATAVVVSGDPKKFYRPRWERFFSALP